MALTSIFNAEINVEYFERYLYNFKNVFYSACAWLTNTKSSQVLLLLQFNFSQCDLTGRAQSFNEASPRLHVLNRRPHGSFSSFLILSSPFLSLSPSPNPAPSSPSTPITPQLSAQRPCLPLHSRSDKQR